MKRVLILIVILALTAFFAACSPTRTVKDPEIVDFNDELKADFSEVKTVRTYIRRPTMYWDIKLTDASNVDGIFQYIVEFLKTSNIFEDKIKEEYSGMVWANNISITFIKSGFMNKEVIRRYEGYYYRQVPGAWHEVDNFNTWKISEERGQPGARYEIGTYVYEDGD